MASKNKSSEDEQKKLEKIQSLQEMIATAERTITSAKQMLSQIQGESGGAKSAGAQRFSSEGRVIHGTFDGQIMIGEDGKQYPVPANYASKSKLVEGDMLKLTITNDGNFVYKQIGPAERKFLIGTAKQDDRGNYVIKTEDKTYKVLLAAATYFKIEQGDEVTIVVPRDKESAWGAIENIVRKGTDIADAEEQQAPDAGEAEQELEQEPEQDEKKPSAIEKLKKEIEEERRQASSKNTIIDEWIPDIEELKKEAGHPVGADAEEK